jgi:hypothetical protein
VNYAELLAPDFSLILLGFLLCRYTALNRAVWEQAEKLVFFVFFPVLLFHSIVKSPLDLSATSGLIMGGLTLAASGIAMTYVLPYLPWLGARLDRREHAACARIEHHSAGAAGTRAASASSTGCAGALASADRRATALQGRSAARGARVPFGFEPCVRLELACGRALVGILFEAEHEELV